MVTSTTTSRLRHDAASSRYLVAIIAALALAGCDTFDAYQVTWPVHEGPVVGEVHQILALWADGVVVQPDPQRHGTPTPGFSARVYLFGPDLAEPVATDGTLTILLYDEPMGQVGKPAVPREVWKIDAASLERVLKKDGLGWGYSLWVPWTTYAPDVRRVRLVVKHEAPNGRETWGGSMAMTVGDGTRPRPPSRLHTTTAARSVDAATSRSRTKSTSIPVPRDSSLSPLRTKSPVEP